MLANIDINGTISKCLQQCQANIKEIENFELTTDFKNIPSSASLKCYLHCCFLSFGVYQSPNSTRLNLAQMMDAVNGLAKDQQDIYFRMTRGCMKRVSHIKDPTEFTYIMNVCAKENDNEVNYSIRGSSDKFIFFISNIFDRLFYFISLHFFIIKIFSFLAFLRLLLMAWSKKDLNTRNNG